MSNVVRADACVISRIGLCIELINQITFPIEMVQ